MKKIISILVLNVLFIGMSIADMSIGRCTFYGEKPPRSMSFGTTLVYYHQMSSSSMMRGQMEYRQCRGDVWDIYRSADDAKRLRFQTTDGSVQICNDY